MLIKLADDKTAQLQQLEELIPRVSAAHRPHVEQEHCGTSSLFFTNSTE